MPVEMPLKRERNTAAKKVRAGHEDRILPPLGSLKLPRVDWYFQPNFTLTVQFNEPGQLYRKKMRRYNLV